jgi:hypothetical protein
MITHALYGGIGNQLFQICTVMAFSLKSGHDFYFEWDASGLIATSALLRALVPHCRPADVCRALEARLKVVHLAEPSNRYHPELLAELAPQDNPTTLFVLQGYFQSFRYFETEWDAIADFLGIRAQQDALRASLSAPPPDIVMHMRVGDYLDLQHTHPILPCGYYGRALDAALDQVGGGDGAPSATIAYLCQAQDRTLVEDYYVSKLRDVFPRCTWTPVPDMLSDSETILYMSLAKVQVIANSTFSLWAAYFRRTYTGREHVIYPSVWFTPTNDYLWMVQMSGEDEGGRMVFLPCNWTTKNPPLRADDMIRPGWRMMDASLDANLDADVAITPPPNEPVTGCYAQCLCYNNPVKHTSMTERFRKLGMPLSIYPGVSFTNPRILNREGRNNSLSIQRLWSVTYGHLDMIQRFLDSDASYGIFCEDDILVNRTLPHELPHIMRECDDMAVDILLLGYMKTYKVEAWMAGHARMGDFPGRPYTYHDYPNDQWGVHMYMLSRSGARRILGTYAYGYADRHIDDPDHPFSPDWTISKCPGLKRALISPMMAVEDGRDSYEHYGHEGQWRFHMETFRAHFVPGLFI